MALSNLAVLATAGESATVSDGIAECLSSLSQITSLITTYPFNVYFGCSILFIGIGVFAAVKRIF